MSFMSGTLLSVDGAFGICIGVAFAERAVGASGEWAAGASGERVAGKGGERVAGKGGACEMTCCLNLGILGEDISDSCSVL